MQVTTKVDEIEFGSLTRMVEDGTESIYVLKVTDIYGSEFKFILGRPESFNSDTEAICADLLDDMLSRIDFVDG